MEKVPHANFVSLSNDFICNYRPRLTRSSSASQIRDTDFKYPNMETSYKWCRFCKRTHTTNLWSKREKQPGQHWTADRAWMTCCWFYHFSSVWVKEEENRSQQWHVSCFMKDQLSQAFLTCNTRAIPHAGQQRSPSVRPLLLKQRKYLPHKYLAARLPASMLAAVNTSRQQPGYN